MLHITRSIAPNIYISLPKPTFLTRTISELFPGVIAGDPGLGLTTLLCTAPVTPTLMLVGGQKLLRAWTLNSSNNRLMPTPIAVGLLERNYTCLQVRNTYSVSFCDILYGADCTVIFVLFDIIRIVHLFYLISAQKIIVFTRAQFLF